MGTESVNLIVQGDVFLTPADLPKQAKKINSLILAKGEHTGHAHVAESGAEIYEDNGNLYLFTSHGVKVSHEEHKSIDVPAGTWKIGIVKEYDPFLEESRNVRD